VLTQVDQGETERARVAPSDRAVSAADVRKDVCRHHGGAEVKRWHSGERIPGQGIVERPPEPSPVMLPRVHHDPAHRLEVPVLPGPPRRRRRQRPVDDAAEVERSRHLCGGTREFLRIAPEHVRDGGMRDEEPAPVHPRQPEVVATNDPLAASEAALQPHGRREPAAERTVNPDRVVDLQPPQERLGVVVRHFVVRHVREHLEQVHPGIAHPCARHRDRQGVRRLPCERADDRPWELQPVAKERRRYSGGDSAGSQHAKGARQSATRISAANARSGRARRSRCSPDP
jgi:hypothetical protein